MPGYMSGSKRARQTASITNRPSCGGSKKGGLIPRVGRGSAMTSIAMRIRGPTTIPEPGYVSNCTTKLTTDQQRRTWDVNPGGAASGGVGRMFTSPGARN